MRFGYIIASSDVMIAGKAVGYLCREQPDNENDSGWRVFSGEESQEYADDPKNFAMYNASTVIEANPEIAVFLARDFPVVFERDALTGRFVEAEPDDDDFV